MLFSWNHEYRKNASIVLLIFKHERILTQECIQVSIAIQAWTILTQQYVHRSTDLHAWIYFTIEVHSVFYLIQAQMYFKIRATLNTMQQKWNSMPSSDCTPETVRPCLPDTIQWQLNSKSSPRDVSGFLLPSNYLQMW